MSQSGKGGLLSPPPHTTWHAGPHQAVPKERRAVAGHFQSQFFDKTAVTVIILGSLIPMMRLQLRSPGRVQCGAEHIENDIPLFRFGPSAG